MYSDWSAIYVISVAVVFLWLTGLSFFIWRQDRFLKSLFPQSGQRDIRKKFEETLKEISSFNQRLDENSKRLDNVYNEGLRHVQKVSLIRYNPYQETGGDQSFSIALLDNKGSGVVITSLHSRVGTRVFAKPIKEGKAEKYELSSEERQVIKQTLAEK